MSLPITVGLYFDDAFLRYTTDASVYGGLVNHTYEFPVGEASVRRWQEFAAQLFAHVGILASLPGEAGALDAVDRAVLERARIEQEMAEVRAEAIKLMHRCRSGFGSWRASPACMNYEDAHAREIARLVAELAALESTAVRAVGATEPAAAERFLDVSRWIDRYSVERSRIERDLAGRRAADTGRLQKCLSGAGSRRASPECVGDADRPASQDEKLRAELAALESERAAHAGPPPSPGDIRLIVAPTIERVFVRVPPGYAWLGNYWVEVTYKIRLFSADGAPVDEWQVTGRGTNTAGIDFLGTHRLPSEAMDAAILDAGDAFMTAFSFQPRTAVWLDANLTPEEKQQVCGIAVDMPVDGVMPVNSASSPTGLVAGIETIAGPERQEELIGSAIGNPQILAVRLVLRNGSGNSWIVRRQDLRLKIANGRDIAALDGQSLILSTDDIVYYEPVILVGNAGTAMSSVAAGLNLFGFIVAGVAASERKELLTKIRDREYHGNCLPPNGEAAGLVYFAIPPDTPRDSLEILISAHGLPNGETTIIQIPLDGLDSETYESTQE